VISPHPLHTVSKFIQQFGTRRRHLGLRAMGLTLDLLRGQDGKSCRFGARSEDLRSLALAAGAGAQAVTKRRALQTGSSPPTWTGPSASGVDPEK
jgi:hypothetical protein